MRWVTIIFVVVGGRGGSPARLAVAAAAIVLALVSRPALDPLIVDYGMYMYGYRDPVHLKKSEELRFFREGAVANVMVTYWPPEAVTTLRVNGKTDASDSTDMGTQLGSAYLPRFLRPASTDVLVVGYGSGTTSGASLLFPGTRVRCAEIEPAVFAASSQFAAVNHNPERSPRFSISFDDARSYLLETRDKFDVILSEPSNPWMAGVSNLFTTQYYEAARRRLKPGGLFAQWIQLYSFNPHDYAMVLRTVTSVFLHAALLKTVEGDTLLVASDAPIGPTKETLRQAQSLVDSIPEVKSDLQNYFGTTDVFTLMFEHQIMDEKGVRRYIEKDGRTWVNTDLNLRLEFDAPRNLFSPQTGAVEASIRAATEPSQFAEEFKAWGGSKDQAALFNAIALQFTGLGMNDKAAQVVDLGLAENPDRPELLGARLVLSPVGQPEFEQAVPKIVAASEALADHIGMAFLEAKKYQRAIELFQRLAAARPGSATVWHNLAQAYEGAGERDKADEAFRKAVSIDPVDERFEQSYEQFKRADTSH